MLEHRTLSIEHFRLSTVRRIASLLLLVAAAVCLRPAPRAAGDTYREWAAYGGGLEQMGYSSLTQINRPNVGQLALAWSYDTGESGGLQTQPIVADGVLYAYTPSHKTFALRADTGQPLGTFNPPRKGRGPNRGVMYGARG